MTPGGANPCWVSGEDLCWVPGVRILSVVEPPQRWSKVDGELPPLVLDRTIFEKAPSHLYW